MNRFRTTRKRAKDAPPPMPAPPSEDLGRPSLSSLTGKSFKRKTKNQPAPAPVFDLANALPSSDDFRTSLLMPKLSARFSMLREQDDPNTKLGKASDDSVLFPKRKSRIFLSDIDEVDSTLGSVRPPFAADGRTDSYASDGYGTDDDYSGGSVLNRARPAEGNNLFGGRQKIYKIPTEGSASAKDLNASNAKFLYQSDVSLSAFQKLRERERELEREGLPEQEEDELQNSFDDNPRGRAPSPPLSSYNRNRETSSSTTSGPSYGRISTAATSIASQGGMSIYGNSAPALPYNPPSGTPNADRSATKSRRLYEPGLEQHLQDQQSSAMSRLEQIARQRNMGTPPPGQYASLSQTTSLTNLRDRYDRGAMSRSPSSRMRPVSPPPSAPSGNLGQFQFSVSESKTANTSPNPMTMHTPPLSPPYSEGEDNAVLPAAIQPGDRGKATALGTFQKPSRPYDDQQYSQRQLQLQRGRRPSSPPRISPPLPPSSILGEPPSRALPELPNAAPLAPRDGPLRGLRVRANSQAAVIDHVDNTTWTSASVSPVEEPIVENDETYRAPTSASDVSSLEDGEARSTQRLPAVGGASMATTNDRMGPVSTPAEAPAPEPLSDGLSEPEWMHRESTQRALSGGSASTRALKKQKSTPTLGPLPGVEADPPAEESSAGLSGLVRQHLRNDSGTSSVYPTPSPIYSRFLIDDPDRPEVPDLRLTQYSQYSVYSNHGGPWEHEEADAAPPAETDAVRPPVPAAPTMRPTTSADGSNKRNGTMGILKSKPSQGGLAGGSDSPVKAMKMLGLNGPDLKSEQVQMADEARKRHVEDARWKEEEDKMLRSVVRGQKLPQPIRSLQQNQRGDAARASDQPASAGPRGITPPSTRHNGPRGNPPPSPRRVEQGNQARSANRDGRHGAEPLQSSGEGSQVGSEGGRFKPHRSSPPRPSGPAQALPSDGSYPTGAAAPRSKHNPPMLPAPASTASPVISSPRPSPLAPFSANATPTLHDLTPSTSTVTSPTSMTSRAGVQTYASHTPTHRKRHVDKADISEPTFLSCTSSITTINLPAVTSLANGGVAVAAEAPPVPPINPRRRRMGVMNALGRGLKHETLDGSGPAIEANRYSDHERRARPEWQGHKLRKSSSEGANLNMMMRQQESQPSSPAVPTHAMGGPQFRLPAPPAADGSMF
ncbi:MAG: hypothetical protein M1838_005096 [Thelocarpon superellum]|nr:MAG: hypothetical protein M1838_005096 [Thelocarpon superellum]